METDNLKSEALLELIFCAETKETEDDVINTVLPTYLRKLNCFMASVLKNGKTELIVKHLLPFTFKEDDSWQYIIEYISNTPKDKKKGYCELFYNESYFYIYCLADYGFLVLGRKKQFEHIFKNEFRFVVNFLGKIISQSIEDELRKEAEKKLSEERRLLRVIIDNIPINIYAKDLEYRKTLANTYELLHLGNKAEAEVLGKTDFDLYGNEIAKNTLLEDKLVLLDGKQILSEEKHVGKDKWALISKLPLKNEEGGITGMVGISIDYTERKKTQEQLSLFMKLFDNISDAIFVNSEDGQLFYINKIAGERIGISPDKVSDYKTTDYLVTFPTKDAWIQHVRELKKKDFLTTLGINLNQKTGEKFPVEVTVKYVDISGKGYVVAISRDITDRMKAEEALHESEEKFRLMTENSSDVIWHLDTNFICDYISPADKRMRGYKQEEVLGKSLMIHLKPEGIENVININAKRFADEMKGIRTGTIHFELEQLCKDGRWIWTEANSTAHYNEKDEIIGYHGVTRDINERKRAEIALKESEIKYRELVKNSPDAIVIYTDGKVVFVNNESIRLMAADNAEQLVGKSVMQFVHPDCRELVVKRMKESLDDGIVMQPMEEKFIRLDGSEVEVEVKAMQIIHDNELSVQLIVRDITQRKQAELEFQANEKKYRQITENMLDIVWTTDMNFNLTFLSPSAEKLYGESIEKQMNRPMTEKFSPKSMKVLLSLFTLEMEKENDPTSDKNRTLKLEVEHYRADKSIFWAEINMSILRDENGNAIGIQGLTQDISERKNAEDALRESEERKASLIASMSDLVFVLDNDLILNEYHIPTDADLFFEPDQYLGKSFDSMEIHEPSKSLIKEVLNYCLENSSFSKTEIYFDLPTGRLWFDLHATVLKDQHGKQSGVTCVARDITYRKQREEIIRQQVTMQEILIKISSIYINIDLNKVEPTIQNSLKELGEFVGADRAYIFDYDFNANTTSNTYEWCATGVSPEIDNLQKLPLEYIPYFLEKHQKGEELYIEDVLALPDDGPGSTRGVLEPQGIKSLISLPMMKSDKLLGFVGFDSVRRYHSYSDKEKNLLQVFAQMLVNVRERKRSETLLMLQEEKYRNIISNMNLGIIEVDKEENIMYANQSFSSISGYCINELQTMKATTFINKLEDKKVMEGKLEIRENGISDSYELEVKNKNGESRWWLISGAPNYNDNNEMIGSIGIHLDITEQKELEKELEQAIFAAEKASKAKEVFLANMSHEIRTPLNVITGMVRELGKEQLTERQHSYVAHSETAAFHLLTIVNNILDMSKIEAGEFELESKDFSISAVASDVRSILFSKAKEKKIELRIVESSQIRRSLIGDAGRLRQILINLMGNALKFTDSGFVELKVSVINTNKYFQRLHFEVNDSGIGMSEEFIHKLFDKFSQEDGESNRRYEGTGLGMSITKELVQLMGGIIEAKSNKGEGTHIFFDLNLPIGDETKLVNKNNVKFDAKCFDGVKVLLVEDNEMNRFIAIQSLNYVGCKVTEAENGLEAINQLKTGDFDLVLMDIQMPEMDGMEATKQIRNKLGKNVPIVALTANAFKHDIDLYLSLGMNDYLIKPYRETDLYEKIALYKDLKFSDLNLTNLKLENKILYDLTQLKEMSRGDESFVNKMLDIFNDLATQTIVQLNDSLEKKDICSIQKLAHKIKPSIDNMGIISLKDKIRQLEKFNSETKSISDLRVLVVEITFVLQSVIDSIITSK